MRLLTKSGIRSEDADEVALVHRNGDHPSVTIVVGVLCTDGIVIGADSAGTWMQGSAASRCRVRKLSCFNVKGNDVVMGLSGSTALAQRFEGSVKQAWEHTKTKTTLQEAGDLVSKKMRAFLMGEAQYAAAVSSVAPNVKNITNHNALVGCRFEKRLGLLLFDEHAQHEVIDQTVYAAIGSGAAPALPFLELLKRVLWDHRTPSLASGTLGAYWALRHVIDSAPGFVGGPIEIVQLTESGSGSSVSKTLDADEVEHHQLLVNELEGKLRNAMLGLLESKLEEPPEAPPSDGD